LTDQKTGVVFRRPPFFIVLKEEINGFRIHITVKKLPFYVEN